jgi:ubiquinone/menaquinone biosynthesis C-methylase UbiE
MVRVFHPEGIPGIGAYFYNALSGTQIFERHYDLVAHEVLARCPAGRLLDVGTGPARLLIALHRLAPDLQLIGIDVSQAMVDRANENLKAAGLAGVVEMRRAEARRLPFEDNAFDAVVTTGSMHHWKDPQACLAEAYRVLKPGGVALLYDLVANTPNDVRARMAGQFGRLRVFLFWLHSFEEPFYSHEAMRELAGAASFAEIDAKWVGLLYGVAARKPVA